MGACTDARLVALREIVVVLLEAAVSMAINRFEREAA